MPDGYSIEARSLSVAGVGSHDFWVLRDPQGKALAELHGLATDRETQRAVPIGTDEKKHSLRVWHFAHDKEFAAEHGIRPTAESYIQDGQQHRTALTGSKEEILGRWNAAVAAQSQLNQLDLDYPNYGFKVFGETVNSNSTYRTLGEIMGVPVRDFGGVLEPGIDNRMTTPEQIEKLRDPKYPVLSSNTGDVHPARGGVDALLAGARDGGGDNLSTAMRDLLASPQGQDFAARAQLSAQQAAETARQAPATTPDAPARG